MNIKKIIAREGLIIICIGLVCISSYQLSKYYAGIALSVIEIPQEDVEKLRFSPVHLDPSATQARNKLIEDIKTVTGDASDFSEILQQQALELLLAKYKITIKHKIISLSEAAQMGIRLSSKTREDELRESLSARIRGALYSHENDLILLANISNENFSKFYLQKTADRFAADQEELKWREFSLWLALFGYPLYLVTLFVIWSIKTLRKK